MPHSGTGSGGCHLFTMLTRCLRRSHLCPVRRPGCQFRQWWVCAPNTRPFTGSWVQWQEQRSSKKSPDEITEKHEIPESIKPETIQKPHLAKASSAPKTDSLLSEQTVSNKEQRKADWAIMKEMARYLWPKVCS